MYLLSYSQVTVHSLHTKCNLTSIFGRHAGQEQ